MLVALLVASVVSVAQRVKDDPTVVIAATSMPAEDVRPAIDHHHRRQRNGTVRSSVGALARRTSVTVVADHNQAGPAVQEEAPPESADSSASRVKKKIKHKRTWDEPEAQASEARNATSKRPDRIKTRRRLVPASSTARALRTAAVHQDDPYYDFGKKIKHAPSSSTVGLGNGLAVDPTELRTSAAAGDDRDEAVSAVRTRTSSSSPAPPNHRTAAAPSRRPDECVYPRFVGRRNKSRMRRDANRCLPAATAAAESDARTTRILSTVVTSVSSVVKGNQNKNGTVGENGDSDDDYRPTPSSSSTVPSAEQTSGYPKYVRNRYRNISLPEYLEITRVNQRRLNNNNNNVTTIAAVDVTARSTSTTEPIRSTSARITAPSSTTSEVTMPSSSVAEASSFHSPAVDDSTETMDRSLPSDGDSLPSPAPPPTDLQDFIYLSNGTASETSPTDTTTIEARQRRPPPPSPSRNVTTRLSAEHDVGVVYPDGLATSTYLLTFLAIVPLVLVIAFAFKLAVRRKKKKVFDSSEYSSEYNRSPLDFNTITSSPITTKLPRVPQHIVWDADKTVVVAPPPPLPLSNSRWEFPRDKLRLQTILGQGNFGQVWKAEADDINGHEGLTRLVAVKMVKEGAASREKEDLIRELNIMQHLGSHPNVVTLLACCTEKEPYLLIMEYVMYGKLLAFLRDRRTRSHYFNFSDSTASLTSRDLTVFAYCVARGMDFLVSKKIVHRDLAARNILVDYNKLCKIADFGMSRNVRDTNQIYEQRHTKGALPIRWMAPESLHYSIFTYKTDVWSFGVLMWEIVTLGSTPYCTMGAREVMRRVREGYRLDKPAHCRSELFRVIIKCWAADPSKRPTFAELKQELGALLENPEFEGSYVDLESLVDESENGAKDRQ